MGVRRFLLQYAEDRGLAGPVQLQGAVAAGASAQDHAAGSRAIQSLHCGFSCGRHVGRAVEPSLFFAGHVGTR